MSEPWDAVVVGAGLAGATVAERLAAGGLRVLVAEQRPHLAGNAHDEVNGDGLLIHPYGPHIFHTSSPKIVDYLSRFTAWRPYEHRVVARVGKLLVPMPINRTTVNLLCGTSLRTEDDAAAWFAAQAEPRERIETAEDAVVAKVGRVLYEALFRGYTRKQWGRSPAELGAQVTARVPARTSDDPRYFLDDFQAMPLDGYDAMVGKMLASPRIELRLSTPYAAVRSLPHREVVWTGPLDEWFGFALGRLPYRSLAFEWTALPVARAQPVATINEPSPDVPWTRATEITWLTGQTAAHTAVVREYPRATGEPYYPVPSPETDALRRAYLDLGEWQPAVHFLGRLGTYRYHDMHQVVGAGLALAESLLARPRPWPSLAS